MNIDFLNQRAGAENIGDTLNTLLSGNRFHHVKVLMGFVTEGGLGCLKHSLEAFYDRGGIMEFIIGIDQGITTHAALDYLRTRFPGASVYLFHDESQQITFHPKAIVCESDDEAVCVVGSANLTLGGLFSNCECGVLIEIDKHKDKTELQNVLSLWDAYRNPAPPFEPSHLRELTSIWLKDNATIMRKFSASTKKSSHGKKFNGFGKVALKFRKVPRLTKKTRATPVRKSSAQYSTGKKLYLEVLKETGAGGTQVQIPVDAVTEFFDGDVSRPQHLRLTFDNKSFRDAYIYHFANNTHRMSINEVGPLKRPMILLITKISHHQRSYLCKVIEGATYLTEIKKCDRQTRQGAKKWRIAND